MGPPEAENVHWVSLDFKTILKWDVPPSNYTFTVMLSEDNDDWNSVPDCITISDTECDLTDALWPLNSVYTADVTTEGIPGSDYDPEEFPHTLSLPFNPYRESEISAVAFTVQNVAERSVTLNISDPLTGIHIEGKQLTIRDIFKQDLKYKVSYYKAGSTGKRDHIADSNTAPIPNLDPGQSYCFMVAAFIPSRIKAKQQGEWSTQTCTPGNKNILEELNLSTVFVAVFIPLVILIITVTVIVIYCKCCRRRHKNVQTSQSTVI